MAVGLSGQEAFEDGERVIVTDDPPDAKAERDELMKIVMAELPNLSDQEAQFVRRHFLRDENVEDIAASMGLSKSWGSRILTRALGKLSKRLRAVA
jgi:RNA polymerase sigma factor (sigma-70 family)